MTVFELIVRPFQTRDVTPPIRIIGKEKIVESPSQSYGKEGGKVFPFSFFQSMTVETAQEFTEINRETVKKRVENPDDSTQFVEVEQVKKLFLRSDSDPKIKPIYNLKTG
jgi:hypothetical protein